MWIVDTALKAREEQRKPIRVGIVGAGFMCQGLTNQIAHSVDRKGIVLLFVRNALGADLAACLFDRHADHHGCLQFLRGARAQPGAPARVEAIDHGIQRA